MGVDNAMKDFNKLSLHVHDHGDYVDYREAKAIVDNLTLRIKKLEEQNQELNKALTICVEDLEKANNQLSAC